MRDLTEFLDPELKAPIRAALQQMLPMSFDNLPAARANSRRMTEAMKSMMPEIPGVTASDGKVPGPPGAPDVPVRLYRPADGTGLLPAILWIHGGGYMLGDIEQEDFTCRRLALAGRCAVVSVDYRLAPENPYPAPLEDCYAALRWLAAHTAELGVDGRRLAIGGASAGGGLAAGLALLARDRKEVKVIFQMLIYPMIDDRNTTPADETHPDALFWTRQSNRIGWRAYLGREPGGSDIPYYAAAARAPVLKGLPPAFISVGDLDLFAQEDIEYARRLINEGIPTELHVYPGGCHAFDMMAPAAAISRRFTEDMHRALERALHGRFPGTG